MDAYTAWLEKLTRALSLRTPPDAWIEGRYAIVGAGGVGSWTTLLLAMHARPGKTTICIIDDDRLELHNSNRLPYPMYMVLNGDYKALALANTIDMVRPGLDIKPIIARLTEDSYEGVLDACNPDVIIDAVDNVDAINLIYKYAAKHRKPVLSVHYDGWHGTLEWSPTGERISWDAGGGGGYTTPSTAATPAALAVMAVLVLLDRPDRPIHVTFDLRGGHRDGGGA